MAFLTQADRARIEAAVNAAEQKTSAEFVTAIARTADTYLLIPLLVAAGVALLLPGLLWFAGILDSFVWLYSVQLAAFAALGLLGLWQPAAMRMIPAHVKRTRAARLAREQFCALGLDRTADRAGVLLFVSAAEHYVEIIADEGIATRVAPDAWERIVADFTDHVRAGRTAEGFTGAIGAVASILATHFPRKPGDRNELPDHLVEL